MVDCSTKFGNYGCDGGLMDMAFLYTMSVKGLMSEEDYPYTGEDGDCQFKPHKVIYLELWLMNIKFKMILCNIVN